MVKEDENILKGLPEIAAHLRISETQASEFCLHGKDFPALRINGAGPWRSEKQALSAWWKWYVNESRRHPENKRRNPIEPPAVNEVKNRLTASAVGEISTRGSGGKGSGGSRTRAKKGKEAAGAAGGAEEETLEKGVI